MLDWLPLLSFWIAAEGRLAACAPLRRTADAARPYSLPRVAAGWA